MVLLPSRKIPRAPRYSGYSLFFQDFKYGPFTLYELTFQSIPLSLHYVM